MSLITWDRPHFKADEPSRHETAAERKAAAWKAWKDACAIVDARDGKQCRCCDKRSDPNGTGLLSRGHRHHIVYRSAGGKDESGNLITLCASCHSAEHHNRLRIEGNPDVAVTFWCRDADGVWFIARQESAVRQIVRD